MAAVQEARWHQTYAKFFIARTLELSTAEGKKLSIAQVMPAHLNAQHGDVAGFLRTVSAALSAVADANPELEVKVEQPALMRWLLFIIHITAVVGIGVLMSALLSGRHAGKLWWVALALGAAALLAAFMAWRGRPWRAAERITARELSKLLPQKMR